MKKWLSVIIIAVVAILCVVFTAGNKKDEKNVENKGGEILDNGDENKSYEKIKIATLSGPTGFSLAYLLDDENYDVEVFDAPDQVAAGIIKGEIKFATVPTNMAATLNNKTEGKIKLLSIISEGNLYIMTKDDKIKNINDLNGRTITLAGKGATPEVIASSIFNGKNVNFDYKSEHAEVVASLKAGSADVIMLPEPYVTIAKKVDKDLKVVLDINEEWKNKNNNAALPMSVLVMNSDYLEREKSSIDPSIKSERVEKLLSDVALSIKKVNSDNNKAAKIIEEKQVIKKEGIAQNAIKGCNIVFKRLNKENKDSIGMIDAYLNAIFETNSNLIGGKIPDGEKLYY